MRPDVLPSGAGPPSLWEAAGTVAAAPALRLQLPGATRCLSSLRLYRLESGEKSSLLNFSHLYIYQISGLPVCAHTRGQQTTRCR